MARLMAFCTVFFSSIKVFSFVIPLGISFSYLLYWKIRVGTNCSESSLAFERKRNLLTHKELTAEGG